MSKSGIKALLCIIGTIVVFGGIAIKWLLWLNTNPYAAFFFGLILVPVWGVLLLLWLPIVGLDYFINSKNEKVVSSIEEDYEAREEQIRQAMEERRKTKSNNEQIEDE